MAIATNTDAVDMYRSPLLFVLLVLLLGSAQASPIERYANPLGWPEKWEKIISRPTETYIGRLQDELGDLSESDRRQVTSRIRKGMSVWMGWQNQGEQFTQSFVDHCGTDLLDKLVEMHKGVEFTRKDRQNIASDYESCATGAIQQALGNMMPSIDDLERAGTPEERFDRIVASSVIIRKKARTAFEQKYRKARDHKAFAQSASGNWNWRSNRTSKDHAINNALASCRARNHEHEAKQPCRIVHVNDEWTDLYRQTITHQRADESLIMSKKALNSYREKFIHTTRDKAFAQSDNGTWSWRSSPLSKQDATEKALAGCRKNNKKHEAAFPCRIINLNDKWIGE